MGACLRGTGVHTRISDSLTSGTSNALYLKAGKGKFLIADKSWDSQQFDTQVDLQKAYNGPDVAVAKIGDLGITAEGGYSDRAGPEEITVFGQCAAAPGPNAPVLSVKQKFTEWLYDGQTFTVSIKPDQWEGA